VTDAGVIVGDVGRGRLFRFSEQMVHN
jgi:hypothetical protein